MKEKHYLSQSAVNDILSNVTNLFGNGLEDVQNRIGAQLDDACRESLTKVCDEEMSPFYKLQTEWFQLKYIKENFPYIVSINTYGLYMFDFVIVVKKGKFI